MLPCTYLDEAAMNKSNHNQPQTHACDMNVADLHVDHTQPTY